MDLPKRKVVRLKDYDYSSEGFYFITICSKGFKHIFGKVENKEVTLSNLGKRVFHCWIQIPLHYPHVILHEFVIMPNHVHGIIEIGSNDFRANDDLPLHGTSNTIGAIVRGFKIGVVKWVKSNGYSFPIWQRGFHEHIIRNEKSRLKISNYIIQNPENWAKDKFNTTLMS